MKEIFISAKDNYQLCLHIFECENAKGVIQIAHGMEETQTRYENFANFLLHNGFTVITADMRGHGKNCSQLGFFNDKNGDNYLIDDMVTIRNYIGKLFPNQKYYLFSHSMGTIITRVLLQEYSNEYSKVVLCGYPYYQSMVGLGLFLANIICFFKGKKSKSKLLRNLTTGAFNKCIKEPKTPIDWISYNQKNLLDYKDNPLCGFGFTSSGYRELLKLMKRMGNIKKYKNINQDLKILLISGNDDPCAGYEKGTQDSYNRLKKAGFNNIKKIGYEKMRHEILNEINNEIVYKDVLDFFIE